METKNCLSQEDLLRLASLGEVFGGFAHEIAQPLNAIMIASQVVQLKVERSDLPEEEKKFVVHRLSIVTSQVQKASEIVESLRQRVAEVSECGHEAIRKIHKDISARRSCQHHRASGQARQ